MFSVLWAIARLVWFGVGCDYSAQLVVLMVGR